MARIKSLPGLDIIRGFKGTLDYYLWKGLPCVRKWPVTPRRHLTPATLAAAAIFGAVLKSYRLLAETVLAAFQEDAADHERTARDIYVAAVHGHLHEAAMSDFLDALQACRDSLAALEALLGALHDVGDDEIDVRVVSSALPALAATAAHQVTQNASLATIATLEEALESVATDRLIVRGEDQVFSLRAVLCRLYDGIITDPLGYVSVGPVGANQYWAITTIFAFNRTTATTRIEFVLRHDNINYLIHSETKAFAAGDRCTWSGLAFLDPADTVRIYWQGYQAGDSCKCDVTGYKMTQET